MGNAIAVVGAHAPAVTFDLARLPERGETVLAVGYREPRDGGKGSNQAIAAARLGGEVWFIGCVGDDQLGAECRAMLEAHSVHTEHLLVSGGSDTGRGVTLLDAAAEPMMVTLAGANNDLTAEWTNRSLDAVPDLTVVLTQLEGSLESVRAALLTGRRRGARTILNVAPAPTDVVSLRGLADVIVANETEAAAITGLHPDDIARDARAAELLADVLDAPESLITLGAGGVCGKDHAGVFSATVQRVAATDTSGAGDVFCAALACDLAHSVTLRDAVTTATRAATLSVTRRGVVDAFPRREEVRAMI